MDLGGDGMDVAEVGRAASSVLAQQGDDAQLFLGEDFLPWMVLAFGAALVIGPLLALLRPPRPVDGSSPGSDPSVEGDGVAERPPLARTLAMIAIGAVAAVWGLASLLS